MLQTLLFFHIIAVIGLFTGISVDIVALLRVHRANNLAQVRAALLNVPLVGPLMGLSTLLLLAMGIAMIYAGGFGWTADWINAVFGLTIVLAIVGPAVTGRRAEALHALAAGSGEGPVTPAVDAARRDRVLNYLLFLSFCELLAALYVMVARPGMSVAGGVIVAAAAVAALPAWLLLRANAAAPAEA